MDSEKWAEQVERELFQACRLRDEWLRSDAQGEAFQALCGEWLCERVDARKAAKQHGGGSLESMLIHCNGSKITAVVHASPVASIGSILFQADAHDRTVAQFGVPGYNASFNSTPCVLLIEDTGKHTVLYFYEGASCCLRCWRKNGTADSDSEEGTTSKPTVTKPKMGRAAGSGGGSERQRSAKRRQSTKPTSCLRSSACPSKDEGMSCEEAPRRVAKWAAGKDLVALLSTLGEFSNSFAVVLPQPTPRMLQGDQAALRKAYLRACLQLHPDKQVGAAASTQALALGLFQSLSAAFVAMQPPARDLSC